MLIRLYPRAWRDRYGPEFEVLLLEGANFRSVANVIFSALREQMFPTQGANVTEPELSFSAMVRRPSAFIPMVMSFTALAIVLSHIAMYGAAREVDEGAAAHLWQLLMVLQTPVLLFFAIKWLPRAPRQSLYVIALQAGSVLASVAPVYFLNL
jgi:hypothetical protein